MAVIYQDGVTRIDYVSRKVTEVAGEYERVKAAVLEANRIINRYQMRRVRHVVLDVCRFQLANALVDVPPDSTPEAFAQEIARLSYLMQEALNGLNRLCNSRVWFLEELRFKLTYGQSPKKRDFDNPLLEEEEDDTRDKTTDVS